MKKVLVLAAFGLLVGGAAHAQQTSATQPTFVPITIEQGDVDDLRKFLDEQPLKMGLPILQWLDRLEVRAVAAKAKAAQASSPAQPPSPASGNASPPPAHKD